MRTDVGADVSFGPQNDDDPDPMTMPQNDYAPG
jgi:hypothetical protein